MKNFLLIDLVKNIVLIREDLDKFIEDSRTITDEEDEQRIICLSLSLFLRSHRQRKITLQICRVIFKYGFVVYLLNKKQIELRFERL